MLTCALQCADPLAVLDDREGCRCASRGILVIGTIGVVLLGKDACPIPLVAPVIEELVTADMRASDPLLARALDLARENPELNEPPRRQGEKEAGAISDVTGPG